MKTLNKEELKAVAADVFGRYNKAEKVAVTSDGMAFITDEGDNAVLNHSKRNASGKELKIERFTRDDASTSSAIGGKKLGEGKKETGGSTGSPTGASKEASKKEVKDPKPGKANEDKPKTEA